MMKRIFYTLLAMVALSEGRGQDINFSQFYDLPLLRNPALAGTYKGDYQLTAAYRQQWASVSTPYKTAALGGEVRFPLGSSFNYLSVGAQLTQDVAGDSKMSKTQVLPLVVFHKSLSQEKDAYLSVGFMAGGAQQRFDPSGLRFSDQFVDGAYRPSNPTGETFTATNMLYADAAAGVSYSSIVGEDTRFYLGAAYFHFTEPKVGFSDGSDIRLNKKYVANVGVSGPAGYGGRIIFYGDFFTQGGNSSAQGGALYQYSLGEEETRTTTLALGVFYRLNDAVIPVVRLTRNRFSMGLTYDVNTSSLKAASNMRGGFELTLSYTGFFRHDNGSASKMCCPVSLH